MNVKDFELFDLDNQDVLNQDVLNTKNKKHRHDIYNPVAAQREAEAKQVAVWQAYQNAIIKSGQLTSDITKGIQAGENPEALLLKAIECISLMTGDKLFYELNKNNFKNIYGFESD